MLWRSFSCWEWSWEGVCEEECWCESCCEWWEKWEGGGCGGAGEGRAAAAASERGCVVDVVVVVVVVVCGDDEGEGEECVGHCVCVLRARAMQMRSAGLYADEGEGEECVGRCVCVLRVCEMQMRIAGMCGDERARCREGDRDIGGDGSRCTEEAWRHGHQQKQKERLRSGSTQGETAPSQSHANICGCCRRTFGRGRQ